MAVQYMSFVVFAKFIFLIDSKYYVIFLARDKNYTRRNLQKSHTHIHALKVNKAIFLLARDQNR